MYIALSLHTINECHDANERRNSRVVSRIIGPCTTYGVCAAVYEPGSASIERNLIAPASAMVFAVRPKIDA